MRSLRLCKELKDLSREPPHGIGVWKTGIIKSGNKEEEVENGNSLERLQVNILGPENSPYSTGRFKLEVNIPPRYPFEPPAIRFRTKVFHPNIDSEVRIRIRMRINRARVDFCELFVFHLVSFHREEYAWIP